MKIYYETNRTLLHTYAITTPFPPVLFVPYSRSDSCATPLEQKDE